jgi:hypothetical protein
MAKKNLPLPLGLEASDTPLITIFQIPYKRCWEQSKYTRVFRTAFINLA